MKDKIEQIVSKIESGHLEPKEAVNELLVLCGVSKEQLKEAKQKGYDDGHFDALMKMVK
jgi:exonuclease VII small subunit